MNWKTLILLVFIFLTACVTPTPADIFTTKGTDAIKQNKQKEALTYFEEALKLDADHYVARFNAGEIYNSQGNQEKAIEYFTKITEIRTFSDKLRRYKKNAFFNIAAIRLGQKRYNEALVAAIQGGPDAYDKIRKPLLDRLKKSGFKYDLDVHTTSELHIPYPPNQTADDILVVINLSLDEKGNVLFYRCPKVSTDTKKNREIWGIDAYDQEEVNLCEYVAPYAMKMSFTPPYDFSNEMTVSSLVQLYIVLQKTGKNEYDYKNVINAVDGISSTSLRFRQGDDRQYISSAEGSEIEISPKGALHSSAIANVITSSQLALSHGPVSKMYSSSGKSSFFSSLLLCYNGTIFEENRKLSGDVFVSITVLPTGEVSEVTIAESTLNNKKIEACVISRFKKLLFPKLRGDKPVIIKYPLILEHKTRY